MDRRSGAQPCLTDTTPDLGIRRPGTEVMAAGFEGRVAAEPLEPSARRRSAWHVLRGRLAGAGPAEFAAPARGRARRPPEPAPQSLAEQGSPGGRARPHRWPNRRRGLAWSGASQAGQRGLIAGRDGAADCRRAENGSPGGRARPHRRPNRRCRPPSRLKWPAGTQCVSHDRLRRVPDLVTGITPGRRFRRSTRVAVACKLLRDPSGRWRGRERFCGHWADAGAGSVADTGRRGHSVVRWSP